MIMNNYRRYNKTIQARQNNSGGNTPATPGNQPSVMPTLPGSGTPATPGNNVDIMPMLPNINTPAAPGEGPFPDSNTVTPNIPDINAPVAPGEGPFPDNNTVTPNIPDINVPAAPGEGPFPDNNTVMPNFPNINVPAAPGEGPFPDNNTVTPNPNVNILPVYPNVTGISYVRFFNAAPNTGNVDIYVNGKKTVSNLSYRNFTEYMRALPGIYRISVYAAGTTTRPLYSGRFSIASNIIYTMAVAGLPGQITVESIADRKRAKNNYMSYMRFVNLSPNSSPLDVYVDNVLVISGLLYEDISNYLSLRPGNHSITLKEAATDIIVLEDPRATLRGGNYYATYVVGDITQSPGLQVVIPLEGTSYLQF